MMKNKNLIKIIEKGKENIKVKGCVKSHKDEYILFILEDELRLYDRDEKIISYNIGKENRRIISCAIEDLNRDEIDEILLITGKKGESFGNELLILSFDGAFHEHFRKTFYHLNPWKVQIADVDGDGKKEVSIGVYKKTRFHSIMAKRPFIYDWNEGIIPKWRGSRLSKPFEDYIFADIDGDKMDEIISIEVLRNGKDVINSYKWKGFGFEGVRESSSYDKIYEICKDDKNKIYAKVKNEEEIRWIKLTYKDENWTEEKIKDYVPIIYIKERKGKND
ncbi:MAG: VCBS repeat-containing protein [Marinisporobacter sp.]|nr:VCBS repeat-containing protein [Marinisporobacter sp.]